MRMIRSNGIWLHSRADGPATAPPLLLINSLGTDLRMWDAVMPGLSQDFRVIRFDKPGHGLSETAPRPYRIEALEAHARAVLDGYDVAAADVLGLSIGGQIALSLALNHPRRVRRLVLSNTAARIGTVAMWQDRIAALEQGGIALMADAVLERWFSTAWRAAHPGALAGWRAMLSRCDLTCYLGCCDALSVTDLTARCRELQMPVHLIAGAEDGATPPALVQATAGMIPQAVLTCLPGVGHLPCIEDPVGYLAILRLALPAGAGRPQ
ncbi:3-oxoadipate enol-lactonase [Gemmobacter aquatilis]|uniref:3-oxoadipate enol-lactonase n=1 Tax=Gemmobacter aquatilis TaxID=933059 RepID=A0A1H8MFL0_9RHOB|nr:3-oxoadipate enol-lactonase [Gemmobacter aquatilis]SEO15998.1 3-oxoadipate enol-lactonase [Gemmobacter aquatilis]